MIQSSVQPGHMRDFEVVVPDGVLLCVESIPQSMNMRYIKASCGHRRLQGIERVELQSHIAYHASDLSLYIRCASRQCRELSLGDR